MLNSIESLIIFFCVFLALELLIETRLHIKVKSVKRIGSTKYIMLVFLIAILLILLSNIISLKILDNSWLQGVFMGFWIFSVTNIKYSNKK